ncbi:uncharacterized protein LOC128721008 [Anopheles nili]|uniref:uncharacterized protein LOC128721008 n=1 Tax=Anopheles nili TaxID=185578 RepID=UPI00237BF860|nr:uncharacterized protein LOC128721008 [Anopheles nili]
MSLTCYKAFKILATLVCGVLLFFSTVTAVVNNANLSTQEIERREASPVESYVSSEAAGPELPAQVYGTPPASYFSSPAPDVPLAGSAPLQISQNPIQVPHKEYGVPVQNYGPPNVNIEYGPPLLTVQKPIYQGHPKMQPHGPPSFHHKKSSSFLEQLFSTFGFGGSENDYHTQNYYLQSSKPIYGPPSHAAVHAGNPTGSLGVGAKPVYVSPFSGSPQSAYGTPLHSHVTTKPIYNLPLKAGYGPPVQSAVFSSSTPLRHQMVSVDHAPPTPPEIKCDGWKPIAGPITQPEIHAPESSYGPPPSGDFSGAHQFVSSTGAMHSTNINLQLPKVEQGLVFNAHTDIHPGQENSKAASYEIHSNFLSDSFITPPQDSEQLDKYKDRFSKQSTSSLLPPPPPSPAQKLQFQPASQYGPPIRHPGLSISHGSVSGNLKPWPVSGSPPRHPIAYRPPVPQGLIESIGHAVEHQETFGTKSTYSGDVYLPPPTHDATHSEPSSIELNVLPSEQPAKPFLTQHQILETQSLVQEPRLHSHNAAQLVSADCGNGPASVDVQQSVKTNQLSIIRHTTGTDNSGDFSLKHTMNPKEYNEHSESNHQLYASNLPGLDGGFGGLELISAQKSHSLSIPVQGQHSSYHLQFQSADPQGTGSAPHEQILSDGLLQSILSAIEHPQQHRPTIEQEPYDPNIDHSDVSVFLKSPEGLNTLQDHPKGVVDHTTEIRLA